MPLNKTAILLLANETLASLSTSVDSIEMREILRTNRVIIINTLSGNRDFLKYFLDCLQQTESLLAI